MKRSDNSTQKEERQARIAAKIETLEQLSPVASRRLWLSIGGVVLLLLVDQIIKFSVKMNMMLGESIKVADWFYIYFTENPGMAFGWEFFDKTFLTLFRIAACVLIGWVLSKAARRSYSTGFLACIVLVFAGAAGNIFDSIFYGVIFDHSVGQLATLFPEGGGYASWLQGKVVDMFYFPIINTVWPEWVPFRGGDEFIFFRPIFNFADACISVGVVLLLLFYPHSFTHLVDSRKNSKGETQEEPQE